MARPPCDDVRRDAEGEGMYYEGTAAGVGSYEIVLGTDLVDALLAFVGNDSNRLVDARQPAELLKVSIHLLVGRRREDPSVREAEHRVLFQ